MAGVSTPRSGELKNVLDRMDGFNFRAGTNVIGSIRTRSRAMLSHGAGATMHADIQIPVNDEIGALRMNNKGQLVQNRVLTSSVVLAVVKRSRLQAFLVRDAHG